MALTFVTRNAPAAGAPLAFVEVVSGKEVGAAVLVDSVGEEVLGKVDGTPGANTVLGRLKALLTGIILAAGSNIIGKVGVDQTTDGTTNKVNIDASLKSGTSARTYVDSATSSGTILASNAARKGAVIFNSDVNALLLDVSGGAASVSRCQVRLTQFQTYPVDAGYTGLITGIWEGNGAGGADVVEYT